MKKVLVGIAGMVFATAAAAEGCTFGWTHYGDNQIRDLVSQRIGAHVPNKFCPYADKNSIVVQFNAYTLRDMCVGHATAFIRPKDSEILQARSFSAVVTNTNCRSSSDARELAAEATVDAVDAVMANLGDYDMAK